jgi:hypothetical protein
MKSSLNRVIPFLPLFCNCQFWRLDSIQFQAHILAGWRLQIVKVKVKVTLRLTVSQSVSLGIEPHLGLMTRYLAITIWQLRLSGFMSQYKMYQIITNFIRRQYCPIWTTQAWLKIGHTHTHTHTQVMTCKSIILILSSCTKVTFVYSDLITIFWASQSLAQFYVLVQMYHRTYVISSNGLEGGLMMTIKPHT